MENNHSFASKAVQRSENEITVNLFEFLRQNNVILDIKHRGRFFTFLIYSLSMAICSGSLNKITSESKIVIYDEENHALLSSRELGKKIKLNYDYYTPHEENEKNITMPYFMHPEVYCSGICKIIKDMRNNQKIIRLLFAGTYNEKLYTESFHFKMLNRIQILDTIQEYYKDTLEVIRNRPALELLLTKNSLPDILFIISENTINTILKGYILEPKELFYFYSKSNFVLCPPGVEIPHCHNVIEAMSVGAIPVLNYAEFFPPPLEHMKNCVSFKTKEELVLRIHEIRRLSQFKIDGLHKNVINYYEQYLTPERFAERIINSHENELIVFANDEGTSAKYVEQSRDDVSV